MTTVLLVLSLLALPVSQEPAALNAPRDPGPVRLNGIWDLNKDLSTKPSAAPVEPGGQGARGGQSSGGGGYRGGSGVGYRGGGNGGRGGSDPMREVRALVRELEQSAVRITIVSRPESVSVTDTEGVVRKFQTNGKPDSVAINGNTIEVKSKWTGDILSQEFKAGSVTFVRTVETTVDGHQLLITLTPKGDKTGVAGPAFMRFVYDRGQVQ